MKDHKSGVKKALEGFYKRHNEKENITPKRKNEKPEKELTEKPCTQWLKEKGFRYKIIEAKGVWSEKRQSYTSSRIKAGTLDCHFTDNFGFSGWIEFKAPGKLKTIHSNQRQLETLINEIESNCFACVTDSKERLQTIYEAWITYRLNGHVNIARKYLLKMIPPPPKTREDGKPLFQEEL